MKYKIDYKRFVVEFKKLIEQGVSFRDALRMLSEKYRRTD